MTTWGSETRNSSRLPGRLARVDDRRDRDRHRFTPISSPAEIERALALLPSAACIMTAAFEHKRSGMLVSRVMRASDEPASVAVAVPTGQKLTMLIRDSRAFGLCFVDRTERVLLKRFGDGLGQDAHVCSGDPFDTHATKTLVTGAPILARSMFAIDCEVVRHFDLEADYEIYVGLVLATMIDGVAAPCPARDASRNDGQP